jgi:hypothetical protein
MRSESFLSQAPGQSEDQQRTNELTLVFLFYLVFKEPAAPPAGVGRQREPQRLAAGSGSVKPHFEGDRRPHRHILLGPIRLPDRRRDSSMKGP